MKNAYKPVDEYFNQINLGLLERYHTDVSVLKDLYKAKVVVNEQETDYTYNSLGLLTGEALDKTIQPEYRKQTYNIGLYNSDFNYRSSAYDSINDDITKTIDILLYVMILFSAIYNKNWYYQYKSQRFRHRNCHPHAVNTPYFGQYHNGCDYKYQRSQYGNKC